MRVSVASVALDGALLAAAIGLGALATLALTAHLFGIALGTFVAAGTLSYLYLVLSAVAADRDAPAVSIHELNPATAVRRLVHASALIAPIVITSNTPAFFPVLALVVLLAPASMAVMASTRRLAAAFDPRALVHLVRTLGIDYALPLVIAALAALAIGYQVWWRVPLAGMILCVYLLLLMAATTGLVLRRHAGELDLPIESLAERRATRRRVEDQKAWDNLLSEVHVNLTRGNTERGYALLRGALDRAGNTLAPYEYVYAVLCDWDLPAHLASYSRRYIAALLAAGEPNRALEIAEQRLRHDAAFRPLPGDLETLARHADSVGHHATAGLLRSPSTET